MLRTHISDTKGNRVAPSFLFLCEELFLNDLLTLLSDHLKPSGSVSQTGESSANTGQVRSELSNSF